MLVEIRSNLVKSLAPGLWNPEECEDEEEQKQRCEDQEHVRPTEVLRTEPIGSEGNNSLVFDVRINPYRHVLEAHANDEVGGPVAEASHSHGCRPGTLGEELGHKEPGDGSRTDLKEGHEAVDGQHANVAHPGNTVLSRECKRSPTAPTHNASILARLTSNARAAVMMTAHTHMPPSPIMWSVRRPVRSIRNSCCEENRPDFSAIVSEKRANVTSEDICMKTTNGSVLFECVSLKETLQEQ